MKNKFLFCVFSILFLAPIFGQEKLSKEEAAIKKVIEDETAHFMARDYDKWANCFVQSPMTCYSWMSPSANKSGFVMMQGWEDISTKTKAYFAKHEKQENLPKKTDYQFKVSDEMAFVTFKENANPMQSRVLEKVNGQWKILRMEASSSANFMKFRKLYDLQRMAGVWEVDMSTLKESDDGGWKLLSSTIEYKDVPSGLYGVHKSKYRTSNGELRTEEGLIVFTMNMATNTIGGFNSVHYPQSNWSRAFQADGNIDEDGKLNMTGHEVGKTSNFEFSLWLEGDRLHYDLKAMEEGKEIYSISHQSKRQGLEEEAKP